MKTRIPRHPRPAPLLDLMNTSPTTGIEQLQSLLRWKLLAGPHKFPGSAGGTCMVEAAIVVAGMPYRRIEKIGDIPTECISWPVAWYLMRINDALPDEPRQRLLPFVTKLADSAAGRAEAQRVAHLVSATREMLHWRVALAPDAHPVARVAWAADAVRAAWLGGEATDEGLAILERAIAIADEALRIGKRTEPVDPLWAMLRLENVRPVPPRPAKVPAPG